MERHPALDWWSSLSIQEQKEASKKHLLSYQYDYIWNYGYSQYVSSSLYLKLRIAVWQGEGSPKIDLVVS